MDRRIVELLSRADIPVVASKEVDGITIVSLDAYDSHYLHFDKIKVLANSMLFKGIKQDANGDMTLEFIAL